MNRYKIVKPLGDGTYGSVLKAVNRQTGEIVRLCGDYPASALADSPVPTVSPASSPTSSCRLRSKK